MKYLVPVLLLALVGCATQPTPQAKSMTVQELAAFRINCKQQKTQIDFLEAQLATKKFYIVDGVAGNEFPDRISKQFYSLAKTKIWTIKSSCPRY